ncbi:MAG: hypothetical protein R3A52_31540 [Polyangiales bacterium]
MSGARGHRDLAARHLPFNRKERFFTGTVLPAIICADNFEHFDRFLSLLTRQRLPRVEAHSDHTNLQFFTEYSFVEALAGGARERFPDPPHTKDTPDLVCLLRGETDALIAVEAKMYDTPSSADLQVQCEAQRSLLSYLARTLPADQVVHALLLPQKFASRVRTPAGVPVVTWEQVVETYRPVLGAGHYFLSILSLALDRYDELVSSSGWQSGKNADATLAGSVILERARRKDPNVRQVGRNRGLDGPEFSNDLLTGAWRQQVYEVSSAERPANRNWFPVEEFVAAVEYARAQAPAAAAPVTGDVRKPHHSKMFGVDIVRNRANPNIRQVGRGGGLYGPSFRADVSSGKWRSQQYEVCGADAPPNRNWFSLEDFLAAVSA